MGYLKSPAYITLGCILFSFICMLFFTGKLKRREHETKTLQSSQINP